MGRSPCCDKVGLKKGPWTPEEDQKLLAYIEEHGHGSWRALPAKAGLQRCGKSCRLRWTNYLRPDIKRGKFSLQEEQTIIQLHALLGNRWSAIATHLPKRTDNEIKNYWNTHLKKRLAKMGIDPATHKPKNDALLSSNGQSKHAANLSHMAQWESARLEAEARLVRQSKLRSSNLQNAQLNASEFASPASSTTPINKPIAPPPAATPSPCLDVLNALNGVWIKPNEAAPGRTTGGAVTNLESPTSTLSYSENATQASNANNTCPGESSINAFIELGGNSSGSCEAGILKEEGEEDWKKSFGSSSTHHHFPGYVDGVENSISSFTSGLSNMTMPFESSTSWTNESTLSANPEHVRGGIFMEKFTDLLLSGSGDRSFSEGDGDTDNGGSSGTGGGADSDDYCDQDDDKNYWNSILNLVNSSPSDSPVF